MVIHR
jgi:hypothetical protein